MSAQQEEHPSPMDEQESLRHIIKGIGREKPARAEAIRICAIPHWFNKEILAWLRGEGHEPSEQTEAILAELKQNKLAFDRNVVHQTYILHGSVRNLLLQDWRAEDAARFRELSGKTAAYCAYVLTSKELSQEQRAEWEREEMYHLLVADTERGIDRFIRLSNNALDSYRLGTLDLLLGMATEQIDHLTAGDELWIQFFEGKKYLVSGDWDKALEMWERLKEGSKQTGVDLEQALAIHLSSLYKDRGEWEKAVKCFEDSLLILEKAGDQQGMVTLLNNRGFLYKDRELWGNAEADFQRGIEISEKIGDEHGTAISLQNLGLLYKDSGEQQKAIQCFEESLEHFERVNDTRGMAVTNNALGFLYKDNGEWDKAINSFKSSLEILENTDDEQSKAAAFNSLGFLYTNKQEWENAEENFERAREILEKIGDERRQADSFSFLGFLYRDKKDWEKASMYFERALSMLENMGDERGTASVLHNLGLAYRRIGEWQKATDYFLQSLKIVNQVGDEMNAATTMYELALLYEDIEEYEKAIDLLGKVARIYEKAGHPDSRIRKSREIVERIKSKATASGRAREQ